MTLYEVVDCFGTAACALFRTAHQHQCPALTGGSAGLTRLPRQNNKGRYAWQNRILKRRHGHRRQGEGESDLNYATWQNFGRPGWGKSDLVQDQSNQSSMSSLAETPDLLRQLTQAALIRSVQALNANPWLKSIDQIWNANPLHDLVPLDWSEIAHALRFVWLRSAADPAKSVARHQLQPEGLAVGVNVWADAVGDGWGLDPSEPGQEG